MELNNNITIEQFAAFLDGNLLEKDMEFVANAIDSTKAYSDILGEVMLVDDTVDEYMNQSDAFSEVLAEQDFDLPIVPEMSVSSDMVELTSIEKPESNTVEFLKDNVDITMVADHTEGIANVSYNNEPLHESTSSNATFDMEQQADDSNDFFDLA